jgi:hypothetical protein
MHVNILMKYKKDYDSINLIQTTKIKSFSIETNILIC